MYLFFQLFHLYAFLINFWNVHFIAHAFRDLSMLLSDL